MHRVLPPSLRGWPLVGNLFEYRKDHLEVFRRGYRELGPVFSLRLGLQKAVVLIGPVLRLILIKMEHPKACLLRCMVVVGLVIIA